MLFSRTHFRVFFRALSSVVESVQERNVDMEGRVAGIAMISYNPRTSLGKHLGSLPLE